MKKTNVLRICAIAAAMIALLCASKMEPVEEAKAKAIVINIIDNERKETQYFINTEAEFLSEVFDELEDREFTYSWFYSSDGQIIDRINGVSAVEENARWLLYNNGKYCHDVLDEFNVNNGDVIEVIFMSLER